MSWQSNITRQIEKPAFADSDQLSLVIIRLMLGHIVKHDRKYRLNRLRIEREKGHVRSVSGLSCKQGGKLLSSEGQ